MGDLLRAPRRELEALDELARRRATAEQAAMVAEIDAAAAAARAAAAIAAAARAAEEAEVAADAAGRASDEATAAIAAEERTSAALQAGLRQGAPAGAGQASWVLAAGPDEGPRSWIVMPGAAPVGALPPGASDAPRAGFVVPLDVPGDGHPERAPWDVPPDETPTVEGATGGRRAARRHAAEAAEAETTVFPVDDSEYDADYDAEYAEDLDVDEFDDEPESDEDAVEDRGCGGSTASTPSSAAALRSAAGGWMVVGVSAVLAIVALLAALVSAGPVTDRRSRHPLPTAAPRGCRQSSCRRRARPGAGPVEVDPTSAECRDLPAGAARRRDPDEPVRPRGDRDGRGDLRGARPGRHADRSPGRSRRRFRSVPTQAGGRGRRPREGSLLLAEPWGWSARSASAWRGDRRGAERSGVWQG